MTLELNLEEKAGFTELEEKLLPFVDEELGGCKDVKKDGIDAYRIYVLNREETRSQYITLLSQCERYAPKNSLQAGYTSLDEPNNSKINKTEQRLLTMKNVGLVQTTNFRVQYVRTRSVHNEDGFLVRQDTDIPQSTELRNTYEITEEGKRLLKDYRQHKLSQPSSS